MATYRMQQKFVSIGDDYWIEDENGDRVFKVDGKAMRLRKTFKLEDRDGNELLEIQDRALTIRDVMAIERDGDTIAKVTKKMFTPFREKFKVEMKGGGEYDVHGKITDHEYEFERDGRKVVEVSKKWFRVRDTYGVEIAPGEDEALVLAVTVAVDRMSHDEPG
jgi:uncharacterized protein YxjI